ncbi:MAG: PLP-dependent aminotransferase family protein [Thermodesulfobacteriota bacterium]
MTLEFLLPDPAASPKYLALADAIESAVKAGRLRPGEALPTHRDLARALGVTVGTVTRGYAEAARRGLVQGEQGRGTFVARGREGFADLRGDSGGVVDLGLAAAHHNLGPDLARTLARLAASPDLPRLLGRHEARGLPRHRRAGADWARRHGYAADPDNVLVTAGVQHALTVLLGGLFGPGDRIAVECLTYPMVRPLAKRLRLHLVPIPLDEHGLDPAALDAACRREPVRGLYVMPTCQNPTTARMPEYRRHEVAEVCRRHGVRIIEDDVYALAVDSALPPLCALAPELGYFLAATSKVLCDGLRVAFLCAPRADVRALEAAIEWTAWKAAGLMAEIASQWIADGTAERAIAANRAEARERNRICAEVLGKENYRGQDTGYFAWLPLPRGWRAVEFAAEAASRGVVVAHLEHFAVGQAQAGQGVRVSLLGSAPPDALRRGLETLAGLLRL